MRTELIAPCGMNCNLCMAYLRDKNRCHGCRKIDETNCVSCFRCIIRNCKTLKEKKLRFCSAKCKEFPCKRLKDLDKRYRTKYTMSMIENLNFIQENGIRKFIENEKKRWMKGDKIFCVHKKQYYKIPSK
jgi:hypothetical protein